MIGGLALLFFVGCGPSNAPPPLASERPPAERVAAAPAEVAPAPVTPPLPAAGTDPVAADVWTPERLDQLQPVVPARVGRAPRPIADSAELNAALAWLGGIVDTYDADPQNPWAVAHGILAHGKDFKLTDGRPAVPAMFADFGETILAGGHSFVHFSRERGAIRVEPHMSLMLKNMGELGVDPTTPITVAGKPMTVADLYRGTVATTYLDIAKGQMSFSSPDDMPWALQGISAWAPPEGLRWVATNGTPTDLGTLTQFTVAVLVKETAFMAEAMAKGEAFQRKGQGIFTYTCGGAHLLQGASYAVARGFGTPKDEAAIKAQVPLMFYRFPIELKIIDQAMKDMPEHRLRLLEQRMKFTGHYLESMEKMAALGLFSPDDTQQAALAGAAGEIVKTARTLQEAKLTDHLADIKSQDFQLYLDIIGDSAHAVHGLEFALGRATIAY